MTYHLKNILVGATLFLLSLCMMPIQAFAESYTKIEDTMILDSCDAEYLRATGSCAPVGTPLPTEGTMKLPPVMFPTDKVCIGDICKLMDDDNNFFPSSPPPIACTTTIYPDGKQNCIGAPDEPIVIIDCAPGFVLMGTACLPIEGPPCAISGSCTSGPIGETPVSEPALPMMLLTLLGLGFWLRRKK